ncbi:MAG: phosphoribosylaminoimidazolesuccinocarboxamide synthase [Dehalococcoidia bacterium]|jgi:phosphoribosylaminoimidazole-succinocarboxamide synthase|nr:phosphoribosylaminoimidazolesuccinocarboxamide synthase [Dehalococcoidia bacterium]
MPAVNETNFSGLLHRGKVRDTYDIGDGRLLMIATDRISAFDVILPSPIPDKGTILAQMSKFWFDLTADIMPNHVIGMADDDDALADVPRTGALAELPDDMRRRSMVIRRAERLDIECVVRGYITGAGWAEYSEHGTLNRQTLPAGIVEAQQLSPPIFTPSTKAEEGHDLPMTPSEVADLVGVEMAARLEDATMRIFRVAQEYASGRGMIIADTKMEFGLIDGELTLIDELFTADSSRFWSEDDYKPGTSPQSFDKQFVRNWLLESGWDREPPAPDLPEDIIRMTRDRYVQAFERLTGNTFVA